MIDFMPVPRGRPSSRWLVYLLRCSDGSLYCGITNDLPKRRVMEGITRPLQEGRPRNRAKA